MAWPLSDDTNVTLLLCAWFGGEREHKPLTLAEYNLLATWLHHNEYRPQDMVSGSCVENAAKKTGLGYGRISGLLERKITLGFHLEEWQRRDFWILGRGDAAYPKKIKQSMKSQAPPVLFGTGEVTIIDQGGTAIVGPEGVTQYSAESVQMLAKLYAESGQAIIVAGRQSIGENAVKSAVDAEGTVIWALQGSELNVPLEKSLRRSRASGQTVLLSSRSPADERLLQKEPRVGRMLMTLCDSVVYMDSAEISTDRYCVESAVYEFIGSKKCFVHVGGEPTEFAFQLINYGAETWKKKRLEFNGESLEVQPSVIEGSPEHSDVSQPEPAQADESDPEIELNETATPQSADQESSSEGELESEAIHTKPDDEVKQEPREESVADRENFIPKVAGIQGELFELEEEWADPLVGDVRAVLQLCAFQKDETTYSPLEPAEYNRIASFLNQNHKRPRFLLDDHALVQEAAKSANVDADRILGLLGRSIKLGFSLKEWQQKGFWILVIGDEQYPEKIQHGMDDKAPPFLFGVGDTSLLSSDGLAIIGPDSVPASSLVKARKAAGEAADKGQTVIVAGHLKMAKELVGTVQEHSGRVIWVLHDGSLEQAFKEAHHRQALSENRLVIITAQNPKSPRKSGKKEYVGFLATELANDLLYVDGLKGSRDQFAMAAVALERPKMCRLLTGPNISQTGSQLEKLGARPWADGEENTDASHEDDSTPINGLSSRVDLFSPGTNE